MQTIKLTWTLAGLVLALTGCDSSGTIKVTGRILKGNTPLVMPPDRQLGITLWALERKDAAGKGLPDGGPYPAQFDPKGGTFQVPGPDDQGIPPGKYRIALQMRPTREALNNATYQRGKKSLYSEHDFLAGRFRADNSPIVRELKGSGELTVDLDRPAE